MGVSMGVLIESAAPRRSQPRLRMREIDFAGKRVHMIGIGGCGMRGASAMLLRCGAIVSGSDRAPFVGLAALSEQGARISIGQRATNLPEGVDLIVVSAAIPEENDELAAARTLGYPVIKYAELLGEIMQLRTGVAVAGTHGKSTTAALCAHLFRVGGLDPSYVIGATAPQLGGGSGVGLGEHFIVEACEFDRSFLNLQPAFAAILNIEADHLDCYADLDEIVAAFRAFAANVPLDGLIVANHSDLNVSAAMTDATARIETFGFEADATWQARNLSIDRGHYTFEVTYEGLPLFTSSLAIAGRHNVANALAATALAFNAGAHRDAIAEGLATFQGVDRRMSVRGVRNGITIVDDYAHHPTEIRVTLEAVRERFEPDRLWVVFQPHQHSRTRILMNDFAESFGDADRILVPDIYGSRDTEQEIKRTGARDLVTRIERLGGPVRYVPRLSDIAELLERETASGDVIVTMGAGNIWTLADALLERL